MLTTLGTKHDGGEGSSMLETAIKHGGREGGGNLISMQSGGAEGGSNLISMQSEGGGDNLITENWVS